MIQLLCLSGNLKQDNICEIISNFSNLKFQQNVFLDLRKDPKKVLGYLLGVNVFKN